MFENMYVSINQNECNYQLPCHIIDVQIGLEAGTHHSDVWNHMSDSFIYNYYVRSGGSCFSEGENIDDEDFGFVLNLNLYHILLPNEG